MLVVSMPQMRKETKQLIADLTHEGITYKLVKEEGINLVVECDSINEDKARKVLKAYIKSEIGPMIYFNIAVK